MQINKEIKTQNGNLQIAWLWFIKYKPTFSSRYLRTNETVELKLSKLTAEEPIYWDIFHCGSFVTILQASEVQANWYQFNVSIQMNILHHG